jgi:hypothetical protein
MDTLPHMGQPPCDSQWNQRTHQILPFCNIKTQRRTDGNAWRISVAINGWWKLYSSAPYRFSDGVVLILAENRPCAAGSTSRCFILISELLPQPAGDSLRFVAKASRREARRALGAVKP